eukprot:3413124-Pleurochrysis_carterae.AAC.3
MPKLRKYIENIRAPHHLGATCQTYKMVVLQLATGTSSMRSASSRRMTSCVLSVEVVCQCSEQAVSTSLHSGCAASISCAASTDVARQSAMRC